MNFQMQSNNIADGTKRTPALSRMMSIIVITTMTFLVLVSASPSSLFLHAQQAEATAYGLGQSRIPPAFIVVDGKASILQLENGDPSSGDATADYSRSAQGTISFGERFQLLVPQFPRLFKDAQSAELTICGDESCATDDFHVRHELVNVRDTRFLYVETHLMDNPGAVGDGFTASEVGFKIPLLWTVSFTDGTEQTYLAIVHLQGDPCEEHGWTYSRSGTICVDPNA
jgi:hypothetical protein